MPRARSLAAELNNVELESRSTTWPPPTSWPRRSPPARRAKPDLVIWPENSTDIDPMLYPPIYEEIASAAAAIGRPILVGAVLQNPQLNAGVLWLPGQGPTTIYAKRRLVPFGEYIPFRSLISKITSLTQLQPTDFVPGHKTVVFNVGQIKLGDIICYEVGFDDLVRSEVAAGANLLSMQSNDATFEREGPTTAESGQQLAMARIRAVEFDRAVVVASTTGYSAIVAPNGQLISRSGMWTQAELEARVPLLSYTTLAERLGAWPEWAIVAATTLALGLAIGQANAARRVGPDQATRRTGPGQQNKLGHPEVFPRTGKTQRDGDTVHGRRLTLTALTAAAGLLVAACQSGAPVATQLNPSAVAGKPAAAVARYLKISPAPGAKDVNPANGITVTAVNGGKITHVTVKTSSDDPVTGSLSDGKTRWHSAYALPTGSSYKVTATGTDSGGHPVTVTSSFRTPTPVAHVRDRDLRGRRRYLRGRHADHADLQRADHRQGRRRAVAPDHHV